MSWFAPGNGYKLVQTNQALRRIVVDGQSGPEYDVAGLYGFRHSQDWKHYGYEIHGMNGNHALLNIDGKETKVYDDVVNGSLSFPSSGEATFVAREGEKLIRVRWPIQYEKTIRKNKMFKTEHKLRGTA